MEEVPDEIDYRQWKLDVEELDSILNRKNSCSNHDAPDIEFPYDESLVTYNENALPKPKRPEMIQRNMDNIKGKPKRPIVEEYVQAQEQNAKLNKWLAKEKNPKSEDMIVVSPEMDQKIQQRMYANLGTGFWKDDVASTIAKPHDTESVFGTSGKESVASGKKVHDESTELDESDNVPVSNDPTKSVISPKVKALNTIARELREEGKVTEAMQVFNTSITELLDDSAVEEELNAQTPFTYSKEAHFAASKMCAVFKGFKYRRNRTIVTIQKSARRYIAMRRVGAIRQHRNQTAAYIQAYYLKRHLYRCGQAIIMQVSSNLFVDNLNR